MAWFQLKMNMNIEISIGAKARLPEMDAANYPLAFYTRPADFWGNQVEDVVMLLGYDDATSEVLLMRYTERGGINGWHAPEWTQANPAHFELIDPRKQTHTMARTLRRDGLAVLSQHISAAQGVTS